MQERTQVAAVVVSWNTRECLRACLQLLTGRGPRPVAVICVDNGSTDGSWEMAAGIPGVQVIRNHENVGFARAANQGIRLAQEAYDAAFIVLVNSDVLVEPTVLARMAAVMEEDTSIAAVSPTLRHPDGRLQVGAAGYEPTAWNGLSHFLLLGRLSRGRFRSLMVRQEWYEGTGMPIVVDWISGACAMVASGHIARCGLLDESFFLYGEDVDWFCRMSRVGGRVLLLPQLQAVHVQGASARGVDAAWVEALFGLVRRERGALEATVFQACAAIGLGARAAAYGVAARWTRDPFYARRARLMTVATWAALRPRSSVAR